MDSEIQGLKNEIAELKTLAQENSRMLQGIYRRARINMVVNVVKWVVIIGISIGAFYFIQPFLDTVVDSYSKLLGGGNSGTQGNGITDLFKQF